MQLELQIKTSFW